MFSRPKILFLVSLLFVALLNPKFNPYLLFKFLIFYHLLYKAEKPSVCLSALFGRSDSQPWLHGSTSDLLDVIAMSSGMTKFIFKSF